MKKFTSTLHASKTDATNTSFRRNAVIMITELQADSEL